MSHRTATILVACLGIALFSAMDAVMKGLALALGAYSAALWRALAGTVLAGVPWLASRPRRPGRVAMTLHAVRGVLVVAMAVSFFFALTRLPVAEAIALTFIAPLIALFLASAILGEAVPPGAYAGCGLALIGVAVIALGEAAGGGRSWAGVGAVLFSAVCYAFNLILQRRQALAARPLEVGFFQNGVALIVLAAIALIVPPSAPAGHWPMIVLGAALSTTSLLLMSWAYGRAEASALVPIEYTAFLWGALFGWAVFGERPGIATFAGAGLIVLGCVVAMRRRRVPAGMEMA